ncbi:MAG: hypothetical protein ACJ8AT_22900 [Hyalangium sp.]
MHVPPGAGRDFIAEIDVTVLTFDAEGRLRLVNRAGEGCWGCRGRTW